MAASHRAAAAVILMIVSLLVAVALSGADARPAVRPDKTAAALSGADDVRRTGGNTKLTVRRDEHGQGYVAAAVAPDDKLVKTECDDDGGGEDDGDDDGGEDDGDDDGCGDDDETKNPGGITNTGNSTKSDGSTDSGNSPYSYTPPGLPATTATESEESELDQELCSDCEEPKPEPKCNTCGEPKEAEKTCNKVHAVREGDSCDSVGQRAGLSQDDFLRFNPNLCCDKLFVGQWVCLDATCAA